MSLGPAPPNNRRFLFILSAAVAFLSITLVLIVRPPVDVVVWALGGAILAAAGSVGVSLVGTWIRRLVDQRRAETARRKAAVALGWSPTLRSKRGLWERLKSAVLEWPVQQFVPTEEPAHQFKQMITRPMLTLFILGDILGAGIYAVTGQVAGDVGGAIWASFLLAFLLALVTAFAYLELVTKYPREYPRVTDTALDVHRAYHIGILSFLVAVAMTASGVTSASFAATAIGGRYWEGLVVTENPPTILIAILVILLVAAVNYRGVVGGWSITTYIVIILIELAGLLFIIVVGAKVLFSGDGDPGQAFEFKDSGFGALTGITAGAATAFYAFIGFEDSVNMAEEVRDPHRTYPPALVVGIVGASIIYLLVAFTAAMTVPLDVLTKSTGPLLEVVERGLDWDVSTLFSAVAMVALSNTMLINMLMASRLLYSMANQGVLPHPLRWVSPQQTPWVAIMFTTALSIVLILTVEDFANLADTTVLLLTAVFLLVNICVLVLRRDPVAHDHFVAPWYFPVLGALVAAVFLLPINRDAEIYVLAVWLLVGGLVLWVINLAVPRRPGEVVAEEPEPPEPGRPMR
jgi:APA family basic amino acid/polyamine antiporter